MWISKSKWLQMQERLRSCEEEVRKNREYADRQLYEMAKKSLNSQKNCSRKLKVKKV